MSDAEIWEELDTYSKLGRVQTLHAELKWGKGRALRLLVRFLHDRVPGFKHDWSKWNVEPPENEVGVFIDPTPDTVVMCFRGCIGDCGTVQVTNVRMRDVKELPR